MKKLCTLQLTYVLLFIDCYIYFERRSSEGRYGSGIFLVVCQYNALNILGFV